MENQQTDVSPITGDLFSLPVDGAPVKQDMPRVNSETERQELAITFMPETADVKKRTIDCVAYSGAKVARYNWRTDTQYDLQLSLDQGACRLERMNAGAPVCDAHYTYSIESVFGVVEKCAIKGGKLVATVRFSSRPEVASVWEDVRTGILRNWSIGLWVHKTRDVTEAEDLRPQVLAIDWEPFELSIVPVPADKDAVSMAALTAGATSLTGPSAQKGPQPMEHPIEQQPGSEARVDQVAVNAAATQAALEAVRQERNRVTSINELCVRFKMETAFTANLTKEENLTLDQARVKIMDQLAIEAEKQPQTRSVHVMRDGGDTMRETMTASLLYRYDPVAHKDKADLASEWRACRMLELAKFCLEAKGESWRGMNAGEIAMAAMTRSDFPNILADVSNKTLRAAYEAAPQTFRPFTKRATAADFKNINRVQLSGAPRLLQVNENGEFEQGALTDSKETYMLVTWGRIVAISRQTIINDDLNAFTRIPAALGAKAAQRESDVVWAIVTANAAMADGFNLFSSDHGNLGTTGAISVTTVDEAYTDMSLQTDPSGDVLSVEPKFILIPTGKRAVTNQFLNPNQFAPAAVTSVIPGYMQNLIPIAESRLQANSATAYYFAADPNLIDTIEYCYLEGNEGVYQETEMGFAVDGMRIKVRLDFTAAAIDYRGLYKNVGS
jgi:hypothetical protein